MNYTPLKISLIIAGIVVLSATAGYWLARSGDTKQVATTANTAREVLYWYDPMSPTQHFDKPGKSPFMDMPLKPKYADENQQSINAASGIQIDTRVLQNLGMRLATVQRGVVPRAIAANGNLVFNQRNIAIVQTRSNGFVTRVYQRAPGDVIAQGAALVDLLIPEWTGAQTEFIALVKSGDKDLIAAAHQRLLLLGMSSELIAKVERQQTPQTTLTITAPIGGVIESLDARNGMTLNTGVTLATINGLDSVWLEAAIPEAQSSALQVGKVLNASLSAFPDKQFKGTVIAVLPETNIDTRTVRVRVELPNPHHALKPGMFAQVHIDMGDAQAVLFIPSEAVIRSGARNIVIVAADNNHFIPTVVGLGEESAGKTIVLNGLTAGQQVVASGQFMIDSEANLQGVLARLNGESSSSESMSSEARTSESRSSESTSSEAAP